MTWSVASGIGAMTQNASGTTAQWSAPLNMSLLGNQSITVEVSDGQLSTQCVIDLNVTNQPPAFTSGCGAETPVGQNGSNSLTVGATDPDACDVVAYSIVSVVPALNDGASSVTLGPAGKITFVAGPTEDPVPHVVTVAAASTVIRLFSAR